MSSLTFVWLLVGLLPCFWFVQLPWPRLLFQVCPWFGSVHDGESWRELKNRLFLLVVYWLLGGCSLIFVVSICYSCICFRVSNKIICPLYLISPIILFSCFRWFFFNFVGHLINCFVSVCSFFFSVLAHILLHCIFFCLCFHCQLLILWHSLLFYTSQEQKQLRQGSIFIWFVESFCVACNLLCFCRSVGPSWPKWPNFVETWLSIAIPLWAI